MEGRWKKFNLEKFYETEREFHDVYALSRVRLRARIAFWEKPVWAYIQKIVGNIKGKSILDLGCGFGCESILLAKEGAVVHGIDISEESIKKAKDLANKEGVDVVFEVANVDTLDFKEEFDVVFFKAALHHFPNPYNTLKLSRRFLKKGGLMIAQEPRLESPIAIVGRSVLRARDLVTKTERPFKTGEIEGIFKKVFQNVIVRYFEILSPLSLALNLVLKEEPRIKYVSFSILNTIDEKILSIPFIKKYAWLVVCYSKKMDSRAREGVSEDEASE